MSLCHNSKPWGLKVYCGLSALAGVAGLPWFYWRLRSRGFGESYRPRLGIDLPTIKFPTAHPRVWLHGVSVGEIAGVEPLVRKLGNILPAESLILSTGTETGQAVARQLYSPPHTVFYYPLDFPWAVRRYLDHIRPDLYVAAETEIWPNFLQAAKERGTKLALINGRLSEKSLRGYLMFHCQLSYIINLFDIIAVSSQEDVHRFLALGAAPEKVVCTGNTKFERLPDPAARIQAAEVREKMRLQGQPVFLAASTHPGEEEVVIAAYKKMRLTCPALHFWLAPRHPERAAAVGQLLCEAGLTFQLWHAIKTGAAPYRHGVLLVDTVGDLFAMYSLAELIFVGGSLVPHGGQNILEPTSWGKVPLYGPHLDNFQTARQLLVEVEAGIEITDLDTLIQTGRYCLTHPDEMQQRGQRGLAALDGHQGAARRQAGLLLALLRTKQHH
jgi:3-deoxy-D-manno-octulosonic-acid transferase